MKINLIVTRICIMTQSIFSIFFCSIMKIVEKYIETFLYLGYIYVTRNIERPDILVSLYHQMKSYKLPCR